MSIVRYEIRFEYPCRLGRRLEDGSASWAVKCSSTSRLRMRPRSPSWQMAQGDFRQLRGDALVRALRCVLVGQRGRDGRVAQALHQLGERGARRGREGGSRVTQVVESEVGAPAASLALRKYAWWKVGARYCSP